MLQEREDPSGGIGYNGFDRVRVETRWKDRLRKESDCVRSAPRAGFQLNLANTCANGGFVRLRHSHNRLETVTEKELKQSPAARKSLSGLDPESLPVKAIIHLGRGPTQKFDMPQTTFQEAGWLLSNPVRAATLAPEAATPDKRSRSLGSLAPPAPPGTIAVTGVRGGRGAFTELSASPPLSIAMPANDRVLDRSRSSPELPRGPTLQELQRINSRRWYRPKSSCDVSQYSEAYHQLMHASPFCAAASR